MKAAIKVSDSSMEPGGSPEVRSQRSGFWVKRRVIENRFESIKGKGGLALF